jgi:DNA (cytosine-5)-methyltransferase 1
MSSPLPGSAPPRQDGSTMSVGDPSGAGLSFGSLCSGIEAATVAWGPLGWRAAWLAEIEPFCCSLLAHHYPDTPNLGDITKLTERNLERFGPIDVLVGGTPCQSFSVAGKRAGLDDPRGVLAFELLRIAGLTRPRWLLFENVPGLLSSAKGRDFGLWLGALAELRYGWAYRILDAQYFGVPQRRRRVFVVGCLGDWRRAAAVLFERESLCRYPPPSRETGARIAHSLARGSCGSHGRYDPNGEDYLVEGDSAASTPRLPRLRAGCGRGGETAIARRLTPRECERLQGFPDDWTKIPYRDKPADKCPDGPRYRALGNSMAVPVMAWLGHQINEVEELWAKT